MSDIINENTLDITDSTTLEKTSLGSNNSIYVKTDSTFGFIDISKIKTLINTNIDVTNSLKFTNSRAGTNATAEGYSTMALGDNSHTEGFASYAYGRSLHVIGEYNEVTASELPTPSNRGTYVCIVGNGTSSARSNAAALDWSGNLRLKGDIYVGCADDSTGGTKLSPATSIGEGDLTICSSDGTTLGTFNANSANDVTIKIPSSGGSSTDTTNTAGSKATTEKIFLIGAKSVSSSDSVGTVTNSASSCYALNNKLYSGGYEVITTNSISSCSVKDATNANYATTAGSATSATSATTATKLSTNAGSTTLPIYFSNGVPVKCSYTIETSVPSGAKFTDTTYSAATTTANGLMSASDKTKLNGIAEGANKYTLPKATESSLGGVLIGKRLLIDSDGIIYGPMLSTLGVHYGYQTDLADGAELSVGFSWTTIPIIVGTIIGNVKGASVSFTCNSSNNKIKVYFSDGYSHNLAWIAIDRD